MNKKIRTRIMAATGTALALTAASITPAFAAGKWYHMSTWGDWYLSLFN